MEQHKFVGNLSKPRFGEIVQKKTLSGLNGLKLTKVLRHPFRKSKKYSGKQKRNTYKFSAAMQEENEKKQYDFIHPKTTATTSFLNDPRQPQKPISMFDTNGNPLFKGGKYRKTFKKSRKYRKYRK